MDTVRIGLIGYGSMGSGHARDLFENKVPQAQLTAIADVSEASLQSARDKFGQSVRYFADASALIAGGVADGVLIATPHYFHPPLAIEAFKAGLHVLIEKPAGVYTRHVREMNAAAAASGKTFGIMFNQRTRPLHQKLRELVQGGELGSLKRINWIITDWYRTQAYFASGGWRATWAGEGGGVLLNQCPHNLDLWQWICGMPQRIRAFCQFGKYHDIEVEDDVTAYMEYNSGATGVLIASTGEAPGTNRLEIVGDNGKLVLENQQLTFWRNRVSEREFNATCKKGFAKPECWKCEIPVDNTGEEHRGIMKDFTAAITQGTPLLAPGAEGINSLELSNAMLLSAWTDNWVNLPVNEDQFFDQLQQRMKK
jgi:predicted dehydrogenase